MESTKFIKSFSLAPVMSLALVSSVNAYTFNGITNVGIGGFYLDNYSRKNKDYKTESSYSGGYFSIKVMDRYFQDKLQVGINVKAGYFYNQVIFQNLGKAQSIYFEGLGKIGFNIFTQSEPLFFNIVFGTENFYNIGNKGIGMQAGVVGAELEGRIPVYASTGILYGVGYNWIVVGDYEFSGTNSKFTGNNYYINAHLGFVAKLNEKLAFYTKFIGKFYDIHASKKTNDIQTISYPHSNSWSAGLEIGLEF